MNLDEVQLHSVPFFQSYEGGVPAKVNYFKQATSFQLIELKTHCQ